MTSFPLPTLDACLERASQLDFTSALHWASELWCKYTGYQTYIPFADINKTAWNNTDKPSELRWGKLCFCLPQACMGRKLSFSSRVFGGITNNKLRGEYCVVFISVEMCLLSAEWWTGMRAYVLLMPWSVPFSVCQKVHPLPYLKVLRGRDRQPPVVG